jgi:hypothetical protein
MIDLAIATDIDTKGKTVIETNHGLELKAPKWPQDCEFQLVAFEPSGKTCEVVWTEELAADIRQALKTLESTGALEGRKPDWYRRMIRYSNGAELNR